MVIYTIIIKKKKKIYGYIYSRSRLNVTANKLWADEHRSGMKPLLR